jgi:adenosine 3'-phospho 5'-phosphosulfate transporter B2
MILAGLLMIYISPKKSQTTVIYEYSFSAISNMMSSWCQYEALKYVSFPASTLFKSFKLVPVMVMGKVLGNKACTYHIMSIAALATLRMMFFVRFLIAVCFFPLLVVLGPTLNALTYVLFLDPQYDYVVAFIIGIGIALFMTSTDDLNLGYDIYGEATSQAWTGIMMLCLYLFFDSFTGQWQSRMFQRHKDLSMIELLFATSTFSTVLSFITLVHTKELSPAFRFIFRHSEIQLHFFLFSICSTIGQLAIFYTIKNFGAVVFSLIMTFRVLLSISLSCFLYGHKVTAIGFFGLVLVTGAIIYRVKRKAEGTQLIKWKGVSHERAFELVREWHEHVDM